MCGETAKGWLEITRLIARVLSYVVVLHFRTVRQSVKHLCDGVPERSPLIDRPSHEGIGVLKGFTKTHIDRGLITAEMKSYFIF
jgi:hypothetical protein